jgi:signal transduction histidine kinase
MTNSSASGAPESNEFSNRALLIATLQTIEELAGLSPQELRWIADTGTQRYVPDGELIFSQGTAPHYLIFVLSGEVTVKRRSSSPVTVFVGKTRRVTGKTPFSRIRAWSADGRASGNVWLLEVHESHFPALLTEIPSMAERVAHILVDRNREYTKAEEQIGRLSALSKLAGNLAHELNNPASAARSAALALRQNAENTRNDVRYQLGLQFFSQAALDSYVENLNAIRSTVSAGIPPNSPLLASELEEVLSDCLNDKGFEDAWKLAPILAQADVTVSQLHTFLDSIPSRLQALALRDLLVTLSHDVAITLINQAIERIFRIVTAVKDYSYMDREPLQEVDIASALDNVLMIFQSRLESVFVKRNIPPGLPLIRGYGSELNQAFSALVENSLDAMQDKGTLTLSVKLQNETILIDIEDDGCGIPLESPERIFEPFFTTKPFNGGLGLGLDTVQRVVAKHFGAVAFDTSARGTTFHVRLPLDRVGIY